MKINTSNSLLNDVVTSTNGYGTFSEQTQKNPAQLECGQKCFRNPIADCTFFKISYPTTLVIKNDGSTARDNCSIERNFLSWLRLSLALVVVGMSYYLRFEIIPPPAFPTESGGDSSSTLLGLFFIFLGISILIWALFNYFVFQQMLADRCAVVEHGIIHFFVAAFVGLTIFMASVYNILQEDG
ncbi:hypothetical protein C1645_734691 [Glomus cerebriforme]|uniref:DUF202 domain-containing protein n=1 Tax=Glomus cerebriforme TaxID=658196 RepID=A0A397THS6_9GLOM|nr:hypothetical protein C1645_734691 [Glomus cerebriforme]